MSQSLRELGLDFVEVENWERALGVFAECVRRAPGDHRARMQSARCYAKLGETERAVTVLHACAEGLLKRDYLLSAIAACRQAMSLAPHEKRVRETLARIHARAAKVVGGRAGGPPPLPPESLYDGKVDTDLMTLEGQDLSDQAFLVLAAVDASASTDPDARPPLPLFADLEREAFVDLIELVDYRELKEGEVLCTEGKNSDRITVIVAGKAEVTRLVEGEAKTLAFLGGGSIFGEISMMTGAAPSSSITCVSDCDVLEIEREDLNVLARTFPSVPAALATFAQARMAKNLIATSPLFTHVPEAERAGMLQRFDFKGLAPGEKIIAEGEPVQSLVLVLAGELIVQKDDNDGGSISLSILREGDIAGEISLLNGLRATATVAASRKTAVALLNRKNFEALLKEQPKLRGFLDELSTRRLKGIGEAMRPAEILDADELVVE